MRKLGIALIIIGLVSAGVLYFASGELFPNNNSNDGEQVVAKVNGEEIINTQFENTEQQIASGQGVDLNSLSEENQEQLQKQALDVLISNLLIKQAAAEAGITVSESDIENQLESIKGQFETDQEYQEALSAQGLSESELRSQLADDMVIESYLKNELKIDSITATDEEIEQVYNQEAQNSEDIPELSEVRGQIESYIIQQKQQQLISSHAQELRDEADVEILI